MRLTPDQQTVLKVYIEANPAWMALPHNSDGAFQIADELADDSDPAFIVWRTSVQEQEFTNNTSAEGTTWSWPEYISRSVGEKAGYERMFVDRTVNPAKPNIRQGFMDVFSGGQASAKDQRDHMAAIAKRVANKLEALFSTGTETLLSPGTMTIEGRISYNDVLAAMGW